MKSIKEKAKAYDEALKYARIYYTNGNEDMKMMMKTCFPVLVEESEDERIRKTLIEYFNAYPKDYYGELKKSHILAWLEKQGGQILANSYKTCKDEWNAEKKELKKIPQRMVSAEAKEALYDKPAWSERDEYRYNACLQYFEEIKPDSVYYKDYLWLKSLKERIKQ